MDVKRTVGNWDVSGDKVCSSVFWRAARRGLGACMMVTTGKRCGCAIMRERTWFWEELKDKGMTRSITYVTVTLPRVVLLRLLSCITVFYCCISCKSLGGKHVNCLVPITAYMRLCNPRRFDIHGWPVNLVMEPEDALTSLTGKSPALQQPSPDSSYLCQQVRTPSHST